MIIGHGKACLPAARPGLIGQRRLAQNWRQIKLPMRANCLRVAHIKQIARRIIIIVKGADNEIVRELETLILKLKYINSDDLSSPLQAVLSDQGKVQSFTPVVTLVL